MCCVCCEWHSKDRTQHGTDLCPDAPPVIREETQDRRLDLSVLQ
jgi:hypothetical protein